MIDVYINALTTPCHVIYSPDLVLMGHYLGSGLVDMCNQSTMTYQITEGTYFLPLWC